MHLPCMGILKISEAYDNGTLSITRDFLLNICYKLQVFIGLAVKCISYKEQIDRLLQKTFIAKSPATLLMLTMPNCSV